MAKLMSNQQLTAVTIALLVAHIAAMGWALALKRGPEAVIGLNLAVAAATALYLALHPQWLQAPIDWPVVTLGLFEILVAAVGVLALRGVALAVGVSWAAFALHLAVSVGAVAFALFFRITRLI
jgi:hypothetical protein